MVNPNYGWLNTDYADIIYTVINKHTFTRNKDTWLENNGGGIGDNLAG